MEGVVLKKKDMFDTLLDINRYNALGTNGFSTAFL